MCTYLQKTEVSVPMGPDLQVIVSHLTWVQKRYVLLASESFLDPATVLLSLSVCFSFY